MYWPDNELCIIVRVMKNTSSHLNSSRIEAVRAPLTDRAPADHNGAIRIISAALHSWPELTLLGEVAVGGDNLHRADATLRALFATFPIRDDGETAPPEGAFPP